MKSQYVTIEGDVKLPGVYQAVGQMRLSTAIALAQGENEYAALENVAVFRSISGKRYAAIFSIKDIRNGVYADPEIFPNDTVIVGESSFRRLFRDIVQTSPFIAVFRPFG
jgi:polysaccharide export outer membrane protein